MTALGGRGEVASLLCLFSFPSLTQAVCPGGERSCSSSCWLLNSSLNPHHEYGHGIALSLHTRGPLHPTPEPINGEAVQGDLHEKLPVNGNSGPGCAVALQASEGQRGADGGWGIPALQQLVATVGQDGDAKCAITCSIQPRNHVAGCPLC